MNRYLYQIRQNDEYLLRLDSGNLFTIDDFSATEDFVLYFFQEIYFDDKKRNEVLGKISTKTKKEVFFLPFTALLKELAQKELDNIKDDKSIRCIFFGLSEILLFNFKMSDGKLKIVEESNSDLVPLEQFISDTIGKKLSFEEFKIVNGSQEKIYKLIQRVNENPNLVIDNIGNLLGLPFCFFSYTILNEYLKRSMVLINDVAPFILFGNWSNLYKIPSSMIPDKFSFEKKYKIITKNFIDENIELEVSPDELGNIKLDFPLFLENVDSGITNLRHDFIENLLFNIKNKEYLIKESYD